MANLEALSFIELNNDTNDAVLKSAVNCIKILNNEIEELEYLIDSEEFKNKKSIKNHMIKRIENMRNEVDEIIRKVSLENL